MCLIAFLSTLPIHMHLFSYFPITSFNHNPTERDVSNNVAYPGGGDAIAPPHGVGKIAKLGPLLKICRPTRFPPPWGLVA